MGLQEFRTILKKPTQKGGLTSIEIPFNAAEVFCVKKGAIKVYGTINGQNYRNKLILRGNGKYIMAVDKKLQACIGFQGDDMEVEVSMSLDTDALYNSNDLTDINDITCDMDVLTAIKMRRSIRTFLPREIEKEKLEKILEAGFCAPNACDKRPWHFLIIKEKDILIGLADKNHYKPFITANCCIIICGDKNMEGINEFLTEDCAAAAQNILLAAHGLGIGSTWCNLLKTSDKYKYICEVFDIPEKIIPFAAIALGYPGEEKIHTPRYDNAKVHFEKW